MDATRRFYRVAHRIGFHPWEEAADHAPFAERIAAVLDREQLGHEPPFGPALDLGCGSGIWGVHLAQRGWQVTGVDMVETALGRARRRIAEAGVEMRLVHGDVTALEESGIGSGYRLLLDTGTFHGLTPAQRRAMGRGLSSVAVPGASLLLLVWSPGRRGPLPRGAGRDQVEEAFPDWTLTDVDPADPEPPRLLATLKANEHWYRLKRN
ncbi:MAG: class I SAM-dependent methyltransferase [Solirubrobacterales bacterium]